MKDWYTRKEVAQLIGVSKATVYHYAKQKKIIKIEDPHQIIREVRYKREEVDALAEQRKRNEPTGLRPSELAKQLNVTTQRIYALIQETDLPVDELPMGDERMVYSIPEETAQWISEEVKRTIPNRGTRAEFYNTALDIVLYQKFRNENGEEVRLLRNENQEWGFYLQSRIWISYVDAIETYEYKPAYSIHQKTIPIRGYTDFSLPKQLSESLDFLDFVYEVWGIENIRLRESENHLSLSIKSGLMDTEIQLPERVTTKRIRSFIELGDAVIEDGIWHLISGYRRTTFDLPNNLLDKLQAFAKEEQLTMSDVVEALLREKLVEIQQRD